MEEFTIWLQKQKREIYLVAKYWPPILKNSIISSIYWWAGALGLVFIATLVALWITYERNGTVEINSFFPPNFGWGVLTVMTVIFLYQVIVGTVNRIENYRIYADKFTWNDVSIAIPDMPKNNPLITCLIVTNNKPYNIEEAIAKVTLIKKRYVLTETYNLPLNLGWTDEGDGTWGGITLHKNGEENVLAIANWLLEDRGVFLLATNNERLINGKANFIELEINVPYIFQLEWSGEIEGRAMDKYSTSYSLRFDEKKIYFEEVK